MSIHIIFFLDFSLEISYVSDSSNQIANANFFQQCLVYRAKHVANIVIYSELTSVVKEKVVSLHSKNYG